MRSSQTDRLHGAFKPFKNSSPLLKILCGRQLHPQFHCLSMQAPLEPRTWKAAKSRDPSARVELLMARVSLFSSPVSPVVLTASFFSSLLFWDTKNINFQPGVAANSLHLTAHSVHHADCFRRGSGIVSQMHSRSVFFVFFWRSVP